MENHYVSLNNCSELIFVVAASALAGSELWTWIADIERSCALLVGRLLNSIVQGKVYDTDEERENALRLTAPLLGNGLQADRQTVGLCCVASRIFFFLFLYGYQVSSRR